MTFLFAAAAAVIKLRNIAPQSKLERVRRNKFPESDGIFGADTNNGSTILIALVINTSSHGHSDLS